MERCFSCAEISKCSELYARKPFDYRGPYFPIFERFNPPSSSNSISAEGTVKVCELCHIFLLSQWQNYERQGLLESRRIYFTKRHDSALYSSNNEHYLSANNDPSFGNKSNYSLTKNGGDQRSDSMNSSTKTPLPTMSGNIIAKSGLQEPQVDKTDLTTYESNTEISNKQLTEHHICCFVCGLPCLKWHAKTAYSSQVLENKEYFPFFEKLDPPQLSIGLTNGATKICIQCESDLQKQWEHYESLGTDQMLRTYHITNEHNNPFSITNPGRFITNSMVSNPQFTVIKMKNTTIKCALCPNKVIDPYNVSWSQRASCLCIPNLKNFAFPNDGIMVDKQLEEAIICDVCHYFLSYQMQAYNTNMTPLHLREYKLPKVGLLPPIMPSSSDKQATSNRKPVTLGSSLSAFSAPEGWQQSNLQSKRSKTPTLKNRSKTPVQFTENNRSNSTSKTHAGNQDQSSVLGPIIANCHICLHELRDPSTLKTLPSAVNEETLDQAHFPFLKILRMNSMKNYEFPVCVHCYYNLHGQWQMFQQAAVPINERKYNHNEFMCTHCQHLFAQKTDIVISRDRLLCVSCSDNRACDVTTKNTANVANQDTDATSHNSLLSMKTKTTVTVTPISNELSGSNLASLSYADTMKQLNATKLFETTAAPKPIATGTPGPLGNSVNQFGDISRHSSSLSSDIYQNSKNLFNKSMKRPVVAAVAPNQRQNTPHIPSESMTAHSDLRLKMSDMANFHGNPFTQNSAFNSFNSGTSGNSNYSMPMFSPNSAFALHSPHTQIGRKSSKSERDNFLEHAANMSNPYFDQKSRLNSNQLAPSASNPFINWTQQHHPTEASHGFPGQMQALPNPFVDQSMSNSASNKEAEMTMLLYMMYQKQMNMAPESANKFPANNWPTNNPSIEEMAASYYQSMMTQQQHPGMLPPDDFMSGVTSNSIQSYMMNTAMANYQYNQMFQMLAAYQQHAAASNLNHTKPLSNVPSWLNQLSMSEQAPKRSRPDSAMFDQSSHAKTSSTPNGFVDIIKYSEIIKSSLGNDHDKMPNIKYPSMYNSTSSHPMNIDSRTLHNHKIVEHIDTIDRKSARQSRDDYNFSEIKRSPKHSGHVINNIDTKPRKQAKIGVHETDVLDLSQNKSSYKCSYAIDSLTEPGKKSGNMDSQDLNLSTRSSVSLTDFNHVKTPHNGVTLTATDDVEEPLNMFKTSLNQSKSDKIDNCATESQMEHARLIDILSGIGATSLVNVMQTATTIVNEQECPKSTIPRLSKCPTILKFHQFLSQLNRVYVGSDDSVCANTRIKSSFMKKLGLESTLSSTSGKTLSSIDCFIMHKSPKFKTSANELYWTNWILKNLQHRLSIKVKPHLRRSLMRPVLSGDIEVRLCIARHKHELESLRNLIKILKRFT